jgi:hypothetical protein
MATYVKLSGTAMALNTYPSEGSIANLTDGNKTTLWHSYDANESANNTFMGMTFSTGQIPRKIEIDFARWGSKIVIGYAPAKPGAWSGFTVVRTIDTNAQPLDDAGVAWGGDRLGKRTNTISLDNSVAAKCWGICSPDNLYGPLSDTNAGNNTRLTVYEVAMYSDSQFTAPSQPLASTTPLTGTAFCDKNTWWSSNNPGYAPSKMIDGVLDGLRWIGAALDVTASLQNFAGIKFTGLQDIVDVQVHIASWGKSFKIGTWANGTDPAGASFTKAQIIPLKSYDSTVHTDDDGLAIGIEKWLRFSVPTNQIPGVLFYCDDNSANPLSNNAGAANSNESLNEIKIFGKIVTVTDGINPKPPASVPTVPYTAAPPIGWTKTAFSTAGNFTFTPAADTTMLLAVAMGAGSGGRVFTNLDGSPTLNNTTLFGGDTILTGPNGVLLNAGGGKGQVAGLANAKPSDIFENWWRYIDHGSTVGALTGAGNATAAAGRAAPFGSTAPPSFTLAIAQTNNPLTALTTNFNNNNAVPITPSVSTNFSRNASYGWTSTNTDPNSKAILTFNFKGYIGQRITFSAYKYSTEATAFNLFLNGVQVYQVGGGGSGSYDMPVTLTAEGDQVFTFEFTRSAGLPSVQGFVGIYRIALDNIGYAPTLGGATGRAQSAFLPVLPVSFTVGKGGIGQPGGQNVTAAQNGTGGSGAAAGGNGGDGFVYFYEYKGNVLFEKPNEPLTFAKVNVSTAELPGLYRSDYKGRAVLSPGFDTFIHNLRPRTKNVLVLMVGAGGVVGLAADHPFSQQPPTTVKHDINTWITTSGQSGGQYANTGKSLGGVYTSPTDTLYAKNGDNSGYSYDDTALSSFFDGSGNGARSYAYNYGGGAGALILFSLSVDPTDDRSLELQIANVYGSNTPQPGAVTIFETETDFGPYISQLVESLLIKNSYGDTATTQSAQQVLLKNGLVGSNTSQTTEMLLVKESDVNDLQVSYMNVAFLYEATDPNTAVSQTAEQVLIKSGIENTLVTQMPEMVFMKSDKLPIRFTQAAEMLFVAELPSVLWLNFGTLEYPVKNQLYTSSTGRATSVKDGAYIQLEGNVAPGTTMFRNGVDVGLSTPIANNDQIYIVGGVTNYYQTFINVYVYYITNGQVTREQAGTWKVLQPILTAVKPRSYAAYTAFSWLRHTHGFATSSLIPQAVKANSIYGAFVDYLAQKVSYAASNLTSEFVKAAVSTFESYTEALMQKANSRIAEVTLVPEFTKNNSLIAEVTVDWKAVKTKDAYVTVGYDDAPKAHIVYTDVAGYSETKAGYGTYIVSDAGFDLIQTGDGFYIIQESDIAKAGYADYIIEESDIAKAGYGKVDQIFEHFYRDHAYFSEVVYTAISSSGATGVFPMGWFGTIAYSVLTSTNYQIGVTIGTGHWLMPTGDALYAKAGFGFANMPLPDKAIAHSELYGVGVEKHGAHDNGYFSTYGITHKIGIATFQSGTAYSGVHSDTASASNTPIKTIHKSSTASLTPYRYAQSANGRGAASLYMGFDTKQDALDFTQNFYGVTTIAMYNGFVYNLDIDKSFVCEIYYNGPISGLIQGG